MLNLRSDPRRRRLLMNTRRLIVIECVAKNAFILAVLGLTRKGLTEGIAHPF